MASLALTEMCEMRPGEVGLPLYSLLKKSDKIFLKVSVEGVTLASARCTAPELLQNHWTMSGIAESRGVWEILNRNLFFVKNVVRRLEAKTSDKYDPVVFTIDGQIRALILPFKLPNDNRTH
jgi:hypothetical protein